MEHLLSTRNMVLFAIYDIIVSVSTTPYFLLCYINLR